MVDKQRQISKSILQTIIYSDIFDYALIKEEIWKFLIGQRISRGSFGKALTELPHVKWEHEKGFYFLSGRGEIVKKRIKSKKESQKKITLAKKIIEKLSLIPTVLFIGISGGLALENAEKNDDIDLFVITSKNALWITRLILVFLLIIMGEYRGRGKKESQKVCLNMLIDEQALTFEKNRQNLYTAHEIIQLKLMFDRDNFYEKFKAFNKWILKYLPNTNIKSTNNKKQEKSFLSLFEKLAKTIQLWYMKEHRANETINDKMLAFHPFEYKNYVLEEYNKRLKRYEI